MIEIHTRNFDLHITVPSPNLAFLCRNLDYKPYSIIQYLTLCVQNIAHKNEALHGYVSPRVGPRELYRLEIALKIIIPVPIASNSNMYYD